jgi:sulfur carrier protein
MPLSLILNGQPRSFDSLNEPATLDQLIGQLGLKADRVAVEHNGAISPRTTWSEPNIAAGDRIEVVHFVGGGASEN